MPSTDADAGVPEPYILSNDKTVISKRSSSMPVALPAPMKPADLGRSLIGETLGHFRLEEFVGGGGMGAVFRATDTMLGRTVAVKVVSSDEGDEEMLRRFRNEAQSAARLDHPNIARVYYVGEDKHLNYIVFEFIEGVNIRDLVEHRGPLPIAEVISYTLQISEALEHAAQRDVVHRDIKPSNILVMPDGRAKLVDMGLARLHQVDAPSQDLTATGVTLGTFDYISPEQARDPRSADVRSDLYSLGCTIYYMLTGMPPFPEGTVLQKLLSHSSDPPPDPRELRTDLDDELCGIALKLMAKQPSHRFQTPGELTDGLLRVCDRLGLPHKRHYPITAARPDNSFSRIAYHIPWVVPLLLLCGIVVIWELLLPPQSSISHDSWAPINGQSATVAQETAAQENGAQAEAEPENSEDGTKTSDTKLPDPSELKRNPAKSAEPEKTETPKESTSPATSTAATKGSESIESRPTTLPATTAKSVNNGSNGTTEPLVSSTPKSPGTAVAKPPSMSATRQPTEAVTTTVAPMPPEPLVLAPNVISVAPSLAGTGNPQVASSLGAAIRSAAKESQVDTIELRFDQRMETPLTISARDENSELTIRAADGFAPLIRFRPTSSEMLADYSMIRLIGGKVSFVGVHFRLDLSEPLANEWSLFNLKQVKNVSFRDCTFTIQNDFKTTATFFGIEGVSLSRMMTEGMPSTVSRLSPNIELDSCIARGQANLVRATEGLPFRLNWEQGFLATTAPAIYARGLSDTSGAQLIDLVLRRVTASLQDRLCLIEMDSNASYAPSLKVDCTQCVFDVRDESIPLVEHRAVDNLDSLMSNLYRQSGEGNLYSQNLQTLWRVQTRDGEERVFGWRPVGEWYREGASEKYTPWAGALPGEGRAVYAYTPADFLLIREQASMAGFDPTQLPDPRDPPSESAPAPMSDTDD